MGSPTAGGSESSVSFTYRKRLQRQVDYRIASTLLATASSDAMNSASAWLAVSRDVAIATK